STYYYLCLVVLYLSHPAPSSHIYTLSLHDALPICIYKSFRMIYRNIGQNAVPEIDDITVFPKFIYHLLDHFLNGFWRRKQTRGRSEEHTSELQSRFDLVCRLLLEIKNQNK